MKAREVKNLIDNCFALDDDIVVKTVLIFNNTNVFVGDEKGQQIAFLQGLLYGAKFERERK